MKKNTLIFFLLIIGNHAFSQVGGISASKLATLSAGTVPAHKIEFEPSFGIEWSGRHWNMQGNLQNTFLSSDSMAVASGFGFRFSYGATEKLEIGTAMPFDLSEISFGAKYNFLNNGRMALSALLGTNAMLGNTIYNKTEQEISLAGGFVYTLAFTEQMGIDFVVQSQKHFRTPGSENIADIFIDLDYGYYVIESLQLCTGFNYSYTSVNQTTANQRLIFNAGITFEPANNFLMVFSVPFDIYGINQDKATGFTFALTVTLE